MRGLITSLRPFPYITSTRKRWRYRRIFSGGRPLRRRAEKSTVPIPATHTTSSYFFLDSDDSVQYSAPMDPQRRKTWRKKIGATLVDVSAEVGVSEGLVQKWESGTRRPTPLMDAAWLTALRKLESAAQEILRKAKSGDRYDGL